jgi:hypothetical protein
VSRTPWLRDTTIVLDSSDAEEISVSRNRVSGAIFIMVPEVGFFVVCSRCDNYWS